MFSKEDIAQIRFHGLSETDIERQLMNFRNGFPFLNINRAATPQDGIIQLSASEVQRLNDGYANATSYKKKVKFVPASGAATRMFKSVYEFLEKGVMSADMQELFDKIEKMPFYPQLKHFIGNSDDKKLIANAIVNDGLKYGSKPKALITFHLYPDGGRTSAEEHLCEGVSYACSDGRVNIHFTISSEHKPDFEKLFSEVLTQYKSKFGVNFDINYSTQSPATDTIAVNMDNSPFRNTDGSLLFRPSGHGALLSNLNAIDADMIYIKTVDNVAPDALRGDTVTYKKCLGTKAIELQQQIFEFLRALDNAKENADEALIGGVISFIEVNLGYRFSKDFYLKAIGEKALAVRAILNRPLRVCGMVRNEGEPGGGPFWVDAQDGTQSLQIAESSQISPEQASLMKSATHFNPVDLVCLVKDFNNKKFDLAEFTDPTTGFISRKSKNGRDLKAQELPGLWNGAMARWNTVFVEVSITTFSPVKVVTDLLRPQHTLQ